MGVGFVTNVVMNVIFHNMAWCSSHHPRSWHLLSYMTTGFTSGVTERVDNKALVSSIDLG